MAIDIRKLKPEELQKLVDQAKKGNSANRAITKALRGWQELGKDSKALSEAAKANPEI